MFIRVSGTTYFRNNLPFINAKTSFLFITSKILEKYELPYLSLLMCSSYRKLQWTHIYLKAVNKFWSKQLVSEIKIKKTLNISQLQILRIGTTHLAWSLDPAVTDVRNGITKARILTGTFQLQNNRNHSVVEQ